MEKNKITFFLWNTHFGTAYAWTRTIETEMMPPVSGERLYALLCPVLNVSVLHTARDWSGNLHFAYCKSLHDLTEPEPIDPKDPRTIDPSFWLKKEGWEKVKVPELHLFHLAH